MNFEINSDNTLKVGSTPDVPAVPTTVKTFNLLEQEPPVTVAIIGTCNQCFGPVTQGSSVIECRHCGRAKSRNNYYGPLIPMGR